MMEIFDFLKICRETIHIVTFFISVVLETWNSTRYRIAMYVNEVDMKKVTVPWNVMLRSLVEIYQSVRAACCFHLQSRIS
jgi:hypothetical protein